MSNATDMAHTIRSEDRFHAGSLDLEDLEAIMFDGIAEAADGCSVEPDGRCPHGHESPHSSCWA